METRHKQNDIGLKSYSMAMSPDPIFMRAS